MFCSLKIAFVPYKKRHFSGKNLLWAALSQQSVFEENKAAKDSAKCNYILFTKLPWPGDSEGTFWS